MPAGEVGKVLANNKREERKGASNQAFNITVFGKIRGTGKTATTNLPPSV